MFSRRGRILLACAFVTLVAANWHVWRAGAVQLPARDVPSQAGGPVTGVPVEPASVVTIDFTQLAAQEAERMRALDAAGPRPIVPQRMPEAKYEPLPPVPGQPLFVGPHDELPQAEAPSPSPTKSFQGLDDIPKVDGPQNGYVVIPPDTMGAVGPSRIFNTLNNNYRVLSKTDGTVISTVSMDTFWGPTGATGAFDPRVLYDPYQNRFIAAAVSDGGTTSSSLLIGVSATSDPAGSWTLARYQLGATPCSLGGSASCWADYPTLGFNQTWIAVGVNMFTNSADQFREGRVNVFNYATLRGGSAPTLHTFVTTDFTVHPVATYSSSETTLYAPVHVDGPTRQYRLNTITGTANSPTYTQGGLKAHTLIGSWTYPPDAPQGPRPGGGTSQPVMTNEDRIINAVFRNNAIWYAQTVGLPAGTPTHSLAQWIKLDTSGNDADAGRVEDTTATFSNGGTWYAYPSISVNTNNDVLLGFSQFSSTTYPSAAYAFRSASDPAGSMRSPVVVKAGQGYYCKTFVVGACSNADGNRWGDYSNTQVDPTDDLSFWTVQEFAKPNGTTFSFNPDGSYWGTWWAQVTPGSGPVTPDPLMGVDQASGTTQFMPFTMSGWAIDRGGTGTGVTAVHVWAYPSSGSPIFIGVANYGLARPDIAGLYGAQFTNSGFSISISGLAPGTYTLVASAYSNASNSFNDSAAIVVTLPTTAPAMNLEVPSNGSTVNQSFTVSGWAIDRAGSTGTGVDVVHVWAFPTNGGSAVFVGQATYGGARSDVAAAYGARFVNSGFSLNGSLPIGSYTLVAYARSLFTGTFNDYQTASITVTAPTSDPRMSLDVPVTNTTTGQPFQIGGWAIDRGAPTGTGVDAVHLWAFPTNGGSPIFIAVANYGAARGDIGGLYGSRFTNCGFNWAASGLPAGQYYIVAYAHSTLSNSFNQSRIALINVQ